MSYNFKKNLVKNDNNCYTLNIILPNTYNKLNYKIYNSKNLIQSGLFENSNIKKNIILEIDKLEIIFFLVHIDNQEYFELINLKDLYINIIENIKINFTKNKYSNNDNNIHFSFMNNLDSDEIINDDDDDDDDDDEDDDNDDDNNDKDNLELNKELQILSCQ